MNSRLWASIFITLTLISLILTGTNSVLAQTGTQISGIISSDTTWTKKGSPYTLTSDVQVNIDAKLTIEAGATVNLDAYNIQVDGLLNAKGTNSQPITFNNGQIIFSKSITNWNEKTQTGCIIENTVLNATNIEINSDIKLNNNLIVNSTTSQYVIHIPVGSPIISNNIINAPNAHMLIWCGGSALIENNSLIGGSYGIQLGGALSYGWTTGTLLVTNNTVTSLFTINNHSTGTIIVERNLMLSNLYVGIENQAIIHNNTIVNGIYLQTNKSTIIYNNILYNGTLYTVYNTAGRVNLTYNWWGTSDPNTIEQSIRNYNSTTFNFTPYLTEANLQAPPIPTNIAYPKPTPTTPEYTTEFKVAITVTIILTATLIALVFKKRKIKN
jgi:hypothetical protein